jgi:tetratricopeptide (TPR) repeat protein
MSELLAKIPPAVFVWLAVFLVQFAVLNMIADSRHFLPDGDDMKFYNDWALRIAGGQFTDGKAFYGLPGYAFALAGIYKASGGYSHWYSPYLVAQLQAALHALTAVWIFLLGCRIFGGDSAGEKKRGTVIGALAAAAWALFTPAQVFSSILMPTAWVVCAFWGMVFWLVQIHEMGRASWWRPWLWMGLLSGFVAMLVATILMLLPLVVLAIALTVARGQPLRSRILSVLGAVAVLMAGVYAGCSPVWLHNYFIAKDRVLLSAHDGLNFYLGNHATSNGYTKIPAGLRASQEGLLRDSLTIPEKELGHPLKRSEVSQFWKKRAHAFMWEEPKAAWLRLIIKKQPTLAWMRLLWLKFANFWNAFQYDDLSILKLLRDEGAILPGLRFGFAAALGLPGLLLCWRKWPRSRWVAGGVLLHMAALMPVFITERYRLAAAPGLLLLAVGGLWWLWENVAARSWGKVALQFALTAGAAWFVAQSQRDIGLWSLDFYKAGIRNTDGATDAMKRAGYFTKEAAEARARGDAEAARKNADNSARQTALIPKFLGVAQKNLETAYAYVSGNAEIAFALGNVWFYQKDNAKAKRCYERALLLSMQAGRPHDGALNNLGEIALEEKRPKDAEFLFQRSLVAEPDDAKTWARLAAACKEQGDIAHAEIAIARAIKLNGNEPSFQRFRDDLRKPIPPPPSPAPK